MFDWASLLKSGPCYIGILNCTPDSFSDGGQFVEPTAALHQALRLVEDGAKVIDVGAESTRPGARPTSEAEEWSRIEKILPVLRHELPAQTLLSIDTRHASTARRALDLGVAILNDVTGFSDSKMLHLLCDKSIGAIAMRSTVVNNTFSMPPYADPRSDISGKFDELFSLSARLQAASVNPQQCLMDMGFGFGTTYREDAALWDQLIYHKTELAWPHSRFCIGISRKRLLAWRSEQPDLPPEQRDALTCEAVSILLSEGYRFFRVHAVPRYP